MKITDVKVFPVDEDKLKAYATITFENCFIVRDLKVISGNKGYFIAMPSKKRKDGTFRDVAHPLNSETRKMIEDAVLEVYERENVTDSAPAPSYHEGDASEGDSVDVGSDAMDLESDAPEEDSSEGDSVGTESDAMDLESDASEEDSGDAESDAMDLESDAPEGESVEAESDTTLFEGDAEADSVDTDGDEITETTDAETLDEEAVVEDSSPVELDQPEETEKGAEENPVIEGSDDPEKAFGYEE